MAKPFDPYLKWLGIPPDEQPANHYRLLGIPVLIDDADVIENAADQRMAHVRTFSSGQHAEKSQQLLNEISAAKVALLNQEQKSAYDAKLRNEVALNGPQATRPTPPIATKPPSRPQPKKQAATPVWLIAAIAGVGLASLLVIVGAAAIFLWSDRGEPIAHEPGESNPPIVSPAGSETESLATDDNDQTADGRHAQANVDEEDRDRPDQQETKSGTDAPRSNPNQTDDDQQVALADLPSEVTLPISAPVAKAQVPDADARKAAADKVAAVFGDQLANARTGAAKRAIAQEMLKIAATTEQLAIRFVLYQQAIDIAKEIGDAPIAFESVSRLDELFEGDGLRLKASVLHGITTSLGRGKEHVALAEFFTATIEDAIANDRFDIAQPLTEVALQSAVKSGDIDLRKKAVQRVKDVEALAKTFTEVKAALDTLQTRPTDAEANLIAGKYYCFVRGEWNEGLPYLALASDAKLKSLAEEELMASPDRMKLGDGWWDISESLPELQARRAQVRAAQHYRSVLPTLTGFAKAAVEKRLSELPEVAPLERIVDLIALSDSARHGEKGRWRKVDGTLVATNLQDASFLSPPYAPPNEYDLQVSLTRTNNGPNDASDTHVRLPHRGKCHTFGIRAAKDGSTALSFWGDKPFGAPPMGVTLRPGIALGKKHTLLFRVRDEGISVSIDGRALFTAKDYSILRSSEDGLGLGSFQNQTVFHTAIVRELAPASTQTGQPRVVDLLAQADVQRDAAQGRYSLANGVLVTPSWQSGMDMFRLPLRPIPNEYDVNMIIERKSTKGFGLNFGFIMQGVRGHVVMDGYAEKGWAIDYLDGVRGPKNSTFTAGRRLTLNEKIPVLIQVRTASVTAHCDGRQVFSWRGRPEQLSVSRRFDLAEKDIMFLGSQSVFHIHALTITPVGDSSSLPRRADIALFNGHDLSGWIYQPIAYSKSKTNKTWTTDRSQGTLISTGGDDFNDLRTIDAYGDFRLSLQWRFRPGGSVAPNGSGVVVRASGLDGMKHNPRGIEIDLRPNFDVKNNIGTGCLLAYATPLKNHTGTANGEDQRRLGWLRAPVLRQAGEWNDCVITCQGDRIAVEMNGVEVNQAWGLQIPTGNIVLRNQKSAVEFRNIRLLPL